MISLPPYDFDTNLARVINNHLGGETSRKRV